MPAYKWKCGDKVYRKQGSGFIKHLDFLVLDAAAMLAAYILAYEIQYGMKNPF